VEGINYFMSNRFEPFFLKLRSRVRGKRCLIVLFGDHGEEYDADSFGHHNSVSDGVVRVPLLWLDDEIDSRAYCNRVRTVDIMPTIATRLGLDGASPNVDGRSLADRIWGTRSDEPDRRAFSQAFTGETAEFVSYQKRLLDGDDLSSPVRQVCYVETVYDESFKLTRRNWVSSEHGRIRGLQAIEPVTALLRQDASGHFDPCDSPSVQAQLIALLDTHNALYREKLPPDPRAVPVELRLKMRNMGYHV
jgi:hypothetical protein